MMDAIRNFLTHRTGEYEELPNKQDEQQGHAFSCWIRVVHAIRKMCCGDEDSGGKEEASVPLQKAKVDTVTNPVNHMHNTKNPKDSPSAEEQAFADALKLKLLDVQKSRIDVGATNVKNEVEMSETESGTKEKTDGEDLSGIESDGLRWDSMCDIRETANESPFPKSPPRTPRGIDDEAGLIHTYLRQVGPFDQSDEDASPYHSLNSRNSEGSLERIHEDQNLLPESEL